MKASLACITTHIPKKYTFFIKKNFGFNLDMLIFGRTNNLLLTQN